jgi:3' terminal RNA ribose 2'-O-methyltransferase Hen1
VLLITTQHAPATDLGYLLHKNPARVHRVELPFGQAVVAYPQASENHCTAALILQVDPVALVRGREQQDGESSGGSLEAYVNDRPYVASSYLSVAIGTVFGTALSGRCKDRPHLANEKLPIELRLPVVSARGGETQIRGLFEPLGYAVTISPIPLDLTFPEWGRSHLYDVTLQGVHTVRTALAQLCTLIPVLDQGKHYHMDKTEVSKLMRRGEGWLSDHPLKAQIVRSFLGRRRTMVDEALEQLANAEPELAEAHVSADVAVRPKREKSLHDQRHDRVVERTRSLGAKTVLELGCGEGRLMRKLATVQGIHRIVGMDVSHHALQRAYRRLHLEDATPVYRERIQLIHGSLMYRDDRLKGFDLAAVVEVIEHMDEDRLRTFEQIVFGHAQPSSVLVTTPNREYNAVYTGMEGFRHEDHRFEWTRQEFANWVSRVGDEYGYRSEIESIGESHPEFGAPSLMGVFTR